MRFPSDKALTPSQINEQIVLYIMSRVVLSFLPRLYSSSSGPAKGPLEPLSHPLPDILSPEANPRPIPPANVPFAIVATLSWGLVMYIFRHRGERLQPGIINSMRKYGFGAHASITRRHHGRGLGRPALPPAGHAGNGTHNPCTCAQLTTRLPVPRLGDVDQPQDPPLAQQVGAACAAGLRRGHEVRTGRGRATVRRPARNRPTCDQPALTYQPLPTAYSEDTLFHSYSYFRAAATQGRAQPAHRSYSCTIFMYGLVSRLADTLACCVCCRELGGALTLAARSAAWIAAIAIVKWWWEQAADAVVRYPRYRGARPLRSDQLGVWN